MKQHITKEQLTNLTEEQKEKLRYIWIPKENDLAVAYIYKDAEIEDFDIITFTIGKVQYDEFETERAYNTQKRHYSMVLRSLRLIDDSFYEGINSLDDIVDELELEYKSPEDYFSFDYCLPLLSIGQMIEILSKHYFASHDFFINYKMNTNTYGIGKGIPMNSERHNDYEETELCDVLWEAVKFLL